MPNQPTGRVLEFIRDDELRRLSELRARHIERIVAHSARLREIDAEMDRRRAAIVQQWCEQRARW